MTLGCIAAPNYSLQVSPLMKYYVSIWVPGTLIPLGKIIVQGRHSLRVPRLRAGELMELTLKDSNGEARARFRSRREGRHLHVTVVSCNGGVRVRVEVNGRRVTRVTGEDALHVEIGRTPPGTLMVTVSPVSPITSSFKVLIAAAHSARRLPMPRLPNNMAISVKDLQCTSVLISWHRAPGNPSYCVIIRYNPKGIPRPSVQCGWEETLKNPGEDETVTCIRGTKEKHQNLQLRHLFSGSRYSINVLILHPVTKRVLSLTPYTLLTPPCTAPP